MLRPWLKFLKFGKDGLQSVLICVGIPEVVKAGTEILVIDAGHPRLVARPVMSFFYGHSLVGPIMGMVLFIVLSLFGHGVTIVRS